MNKPDRPDDETILKAFDETFDKIYSGKDGECAACKGKKVLKSLSPDQFVTCFICGGTGKYTPRSEKT